MSYFISPPEKTDLEIVPAKFIDEVSKHWQVANVQMVKNPQSNHSIEWTILLEDRRIDGSLDRAGQVVHLEGEIRDCAKFALSIRSFVSSDYKLIFYDEGYSAHVELKEGMDESQVSAPFQLL